MREEHSVVAPVDASATCRPQFQSALSEIQDSTNSWKMFGPAFAAFRLKLTKHASTASGCTIFYWIFS